MGLRKSKSKAINKVRNRVKRKEVEGKNRLSKDVQQECVVRIHHDKTSSVYSWTCKTIY